MATAILSDGELQMLLEAVMMAEQDAADGEIKTKTIRVATDLLTKLDVIKAAMRAEGKRFKTVEYLDKLLRAVIEGDYQKALESLTRKRKGK